MPNDTDSYRKVQRQKFDGLEALHRLYGPPALPQIDQNGQRELFSRAELSMLRLERDEEVSK